MKKTFQQNYINDRGNYKFSVANNTWSKALHTEPIDEIMKAIKGNKFLDTLISVIRITEDEKDQRQKKKELPYFVAGIFKEGRRKKENLIQSQHIIIDVDHIEKMKDVESVTALKAKITQNKRTMACFVSPHGDGLKVLFALSKPITAYQQYTNVYKYYQDWFEKEFKVKTDRSTTDVTRACYFS